MSIINALTFGVSPSAAAGRVDDHTISDFDLTCEFATGVLNGLVTANNFIFASLSSLATF